MTRPALPHRLLDVLLAALRGRPVASRQQQRAEQRRLQRLERLQASRASDGEPSATSRRLHLLAAALAAIGTPAGLLANPQGAQVVQGAATFTTNGKTLTVTNSNGAVINWQQFNIGADETTRFVQPSSSSQVLNRVLGGNPSQILGSLQSNGQVFLINPSGIAFGKGAQVDVGALVISTLKLSDDDFKAGRLNFGGVGAGQNGLNGSSLPGAIKNEGAIRTRPGGLVYLVAPQIENSGLIHSPEGEVLLAAGHKVTLVNPRTPEVSWEVSAPASNAVNLGEVVARRIGLHAQNVKNAGLLQATTAVVGEDGRIVLKAAQRVEQTAAGRLIAQGRSATGAVRGGEIEISGAEQVSLQGRIEAVGLPAGAAVVLPASVVAGAGSGVGSLGSVLGGSTGMAVTWAADSWGSLGETHNRRGTATVPAGAATSGRAPLNAGVLQVTGIPPVTGPRLLQTSGEAAAIGTPAEGASNAAPISGSAWAEAGGEVAAWEAAAQSGDAIGRSLPGWTPSGRPGGLGGPRRVGEPEPTRAPTPESPLPRPDPRNALASGPAGTGGRVRIIGRDVRLGEGLLIDVSGSAGGGTALAGGELQGQRNGAFSADQSNAQTLWMDASAQVRADATSLGQGGTVILWADDTARIYGRISARGGEQGGDGGFVETSGKRVLDVTQPADASAAKGKAGTWLLDPEDIIVTNSPTALGTVITPATVEAALNQGTDVEILTSGTLQGIGNITIESPINKSAGGKATLTLVASADILITADISSSGASAGLNLTLQPGILGGRTLLGNPNSAVNISLGGGSLEATAGQAHSGLMTLNAGSVNLTAATANISELQVTGGALGLNAQSNISSLALTGGELTLNQPSSIFFLTLTGSTGGTLSVEAAVSTNSFTQSGGTLSGLGMLTLEAGQHTWTSNGRWTGGGVTRLSADAYLTIGSPGAVSSIQQWAGRDLQIEASGQVVMEAPAPSFTNEVTLTGNNIISGAGTFSASSGTLTVQSGNTTLLMADAPSMGRLEVLSGGTLRVGNGGTLGTLGTNSVNLSGALIFHRSDDVSYSGSISGNNGTVTKTGAGTLTLDGNYTFGGLAIFGGGLTLSGQVTTNALTQTGGTLGGSGTLTLAVGNHSWGSGEWSGGGLTFLAAGATLNSQGNGLALGGRSVSIASGALWKIRSDLQVGAGVNAIDINSGGTLEFFTGIDVTSASLPVFSGASLTIGNAGLIRKTAASFSGLTSIGGAGTVAVLNLTSGAIETSGGTLSLEGGTFTQQGTVTLSGLGRFARPGGFTNQGLLQGSGTIDVNAGTLTNEGYVAPGGFGTVGQLTVSGNLALGTSSTIAIELGGTLAGTDHDQLAVTGSAALGGTLTVSNLGTFVPQTGQSYTLLTAGSAPTSDFSVKTLPGSATGTASGVNYLLNLAEACAGVCWDGGDGTSMDWSYGNNWTGDQPPSATDNVYLATMGTVTVTGAATAGSLTLAGNGLRLNVQSGGVLTVGALSAGTASFNGNSLGILSGGTASFGGTFTSTGLVDLQGSGSLNFGGAATLGSLTQSAGVITGATTLSILSGLNQTGGLISVPRFQATHSSGPITVGGTIAVSEGLDLTNTGGVVRVLRQFGATAYAGTLRATGSGTISLSGVGSQGDETTDTQHGVHIQGEVSTQGGAITIMGTGGVGRASSVNTAEYVAAGVFLEGTQAQVSTGTLSTGTRNLTVIGTGGSIDTSTAGSLSVGYSLGVYFDDSALAQTGSLGMLTIQGAVSPSATQGIQAVATAVSWNSQVLSGGDMQIQGIGNVFLSAGTRVSATGNQSITATNLLLRPGNNQPSQIEQLGTAGTQTISVTGSIDLQAGSNGSGNWAGIVAAGNQMIEAGAGGIVLQAGGGTGTDTDNAAFIRQTGTLAGTGQTITVRNGGSIVLQGGSSTFTNGGTLGAGHGSRAVIEASGDWQRIRFTDGGAINLTGGSAGQRAHAQIFGTVQEQSVLDVVVNGSSGQAPVINVTGGSAGGVTGEGNSAEILMIADGAGAQQTISATAITLTGGAAGLDNRAQIGVRGGSQTIDVTGNFVLQGGAGSTTQAAVLSGDSQTIHVGGDMRLLGSTALLDGAPVRVGGPGTSTGHQLDLTVGGTLQLLGGASSTSGVAIGNPSASTYRSDLTINAGGPVLLDATSSSGARIGHASGSLNVYSGTITLNADGLAQVGPSTVLRAKDTLTVNAGSLTLLQGSGGGLVGDTVDVNADAGISIGLGRAMTASATSGDAIRLKAGTGPFINSAGTAALVTAGTARWLVYSADPAADTVGGLPAAFKQYAATGTVVPLGAGNGLLYAVAPVLNVTISGGTSGKVTKTYDGNATANLTAGDFAITGARGTDTIAITSLGGAYTSAGTGPGIKDVGTGKTVTVSTLAFNAFDGTLPVYGYTLASSSASGSVGDITPKALSISGTTVQNRQYDGTTNAPVLVGTLAGLVSTETVTTTAVGTFDSPNAGPRLATVSYVLGNGLNGGLASNYSLGSTSNLAANIDLKPLTVTANPFTKTFDAVAYSGGNGVTYSGFVGGEGTAVLGGTLGYGGTSQGAVNAGTYNITPQGLTSTNYAINFVNGLLTIDPAQITVLPVTGVLTGSVSKVYDGTTAATLSPSNYLLTGWAATDGASVTKTAGTYDSASAGTGKLVTVSLAQGDFSATGTTLLSNYTLPTSVSGSVGTISPKTIEVLSASAASRVYDGTTAATFTGGTLGGVISGDTVSLQAGSAQFANKNVGVGKTVNLSGLSLTGAGATNYSLATTSASALANITPAALAVSGITAASKVYDATTAATVSGGSLLGTISGDSVTLLGSSGSFANKNVGTAKTVTVSVGTLSGTDAGNYLLASNTVTTTADITARGLTVAGLSVPDKVYDGATAATLSGLAGALQGVISGDTVTLNPGSASATFSDKNVGQAKTVNLAGLSLSGLDAANYTLTGAPGALTASITPKTLEPSGFTAASKIYDATTAASVSGGTVLGTISGDSVTLSGSSGSFNNKNVGTAKTVTVSVGTLSGTDASNYLLASNTVTTTADITARGLTVAGLSVPDKVYDATTAATLSGLAGAIQGVISGDTVTLNPGSASATFSDKNVGQAKTVNLAGLSLSGLDAVNYTLSSAPSTLAASITPKPLSVSGITAASKVYDATTAASVSGGTLLGTISGDNVTLSGAIGSFANKNVGAAKTVTVSVGTLSGTDAGNYQLASNTVTTTADITARGLTVAGLSVPDKVYDGTTAATVSTTSAQFSGLVSGDAVALSASGAFADKNAGATKPVTVTANLSGADAGNYNFGPTGSLSTSPTTSPTATLRTSLTASITPKTLEPSGFTAASKIYDATTAASVSGGSLLGTISGDSVTLLGSSGSFANKNVGAAKTVTVSVGTLSGTDAGNYLLASNTVTTTADITARGLTVAGLSVPDKVYDGTTAATLSGLTGALQGVISGDTVTLNPGSASATFSDKNVGQAKTVNLAGLSLSGLDAVNYTLSSAPSTLAASITPKALTATGITAADKVYDGNLQARLTGVATLNGVLGQDSVSVDLPNATAVFLDKNAASSKPVTVSSLSLSGTDAKNYTLTIPTGLAADITPRPLSLSFSAPTKVYDGNTTATSGVTVQDNRVPGDTLTLAFAAAYADRNVGSAKPVAISAITLSGPDASNYGVPTTATVSGTITQRALATWTAAASGNWSTASNWDALPDGNNVAAVAIPATAGLQVTYDLSSLNLASLSNAATLVVAGGGLKLGALTNTGSLVVASALDLSGLQVGGAGNLNNQGQLTLSGTTLASTLTNSGTVLASGSNTLASVSNRGIFNVSAGTTSVSGAFAQSGGTTTLGTAGGGNGATLGASAGVTMSGGQLQGSGTVGANLSINNAVLAPGFSPGALSVQGDLALGADSTVLIELGGTDPASYDRISASGNLQLGGNLVVSSYGGFQPTPGQTFQVLTTAGSISGSLASVTTSGDNLQGLQLRSLTVGSSSGSTTVPANSSTLSASILETQIVNSLTSSVVTTTGSGSNSTTSTSSANNNISNTNLTSVSVKALVPPPYVPPAPAPAPAPTPTPPTPPAPLPATEPDKKDEPKTNETVTAPAPAPTSAPASAPSSATTPPVLAALQTLTNAPVVRTNTLRSLELDPNASVNTITRPATGEVSYAPKTSQPSPEPGKGC